MGYALLAFVIAILTPAVTLAQTGAASLTGIVTDESGGDRARRHRHRHQPGHERGYTAVSNQSGNYTITSLPVGTYMVKAELPDSRRRPRSRSRLEAMQIARIDFSMELGSLEETVEVTGESQVLQTESATVGEVISGTTLSALPLNGRNTGQLSLLLPGVVTPNPARSPAPAISAAAGRS